MPWRRRSGVILWDDEDLGTIGGPGTTDGKFLWPGAILADEEENLYVSDEGCHRISLLAAMARS